VQDNHSTPRSLSDTDAARMASKHVNPRMVSTLWPFDHELWEHWSAPRQVARFAHLAIQNIWVLQHNVDIPAPVANALVHVLREALGGMTLPDEAKPWLALLDAQQCLLQDDSDQCKQLLAPLLNASDITPESWVAALSVGFQAVMLQTMGRDAAHDNTLQARQARRAQAMSEVRTWMDEGRQHLSACAPRTQAQAMRIGMVANALSGQAIEQGAWLKLAAQMSKPMGDIDRAHSELAAAWLYLSDNKWERAILALEAAQATSESIGWRWGLWFATHELDCLRYPGDAHATRLSRLPASLTHHSVWHKEAAVQEPFKTHNSAERFALAMRHIQSNLGRRISLTELTQLCQVSHRTLTQDFHAGVGQTPLEHINELKVRKGDALLQAGRSLKQVASAVGYETVLGFTKAYVKVFGAPPSEGPR
jgi:AraC-like DNA-binding protein